MAFPKFFPSSPAQATAGTATRLCMALASPDFEHHRRVHCPMSGCLWPWSSWKVGVVHSPAQRVSGCWCLVLSTGAPAGGIRRYPSVLLRGSHWSTWLSSVSASCSRCRLCLLASLSAGRRIELSRYAARKYGKDFKEFVWETFVRPFCATSCLYAPGLLLLRRTLFRLVLPCPPCECVY